MKLILGALCAVFICGCAGNTDYYKAVLAVEIARAEAESARWKAVEAGMARASPEGAALSALAIGLGKGGDAQKTQIATPRDGWDYVIGGIGALSQLTSAVGGAINPIRLAQEARKTSEAQYHSQVAIEQARGAVSAALNGQTVAALRDAAVAAANAPRGAVTTTTTNSATTNTLSGTGVLGSGTYTGPVATSTTTTTTGSNNPTTTNPAPRVCATSATGVLTCQGG